MGIWRKRTIFVQDVAGKKNADTPRDGVWRMEDGNMRSAAVVQVQAPMGVVGSCGSLVRRRHRLFMAASQQGQRDGDLGLFVALVDNEPKLVAIQLGFTSSLSQGHVI